MPGPRLPPMPGMPGFNPNARENQRPIKAPPMPHRARRMQDSYGKVVMPTKLQRESMPEQPKPMSATELASKAKALGLCGAISKDKDVCTLKAGHGDNKKNADGTVRHEQRQVGGPQDGRCFAWSRGE